MKHYACMDFTCTRAAVAKTAMGKLLCGQCWISMDEHTKQEVAYFDQLR